MSTDDDIEGVEVWLDGEQIDPSQLDDDIDLLGGVEFRIAGRPIGDDIDMGRRLYQARLIRDAFHEVLLHEFSDLLDAESVDVEVSTDDDNRGFRINVLLPAGKLWEGSLLIGSKADRETIWDMAASSVKAVGPMLGRMIEKLRGGDH